MRRNIDVLRDIEKEITKFKLAEDELNILIGVMSDDFEDSEEESDIIEEIYMPITKINSLLEELTEDLIHLMDEYDINEIDLSWCIAKIEYNNSEILNYVQSFIEYTNNLQSFIDDMLFDYKVITQLAYDGGEVDG